MNYTKLNQQERDNQLKKELSEEKRMLVERFGLISTPCLKWLAIKENAQNHIIFTHKFLSQTDVIGALFRVKKLCFAKLNYYRANITKYTPFVYDPEKGFVKTELWNSDFLQHKASGYYIDYDYLQRITDIEEFKRFCLKLESIENENNLNNELMLLSNKKMQILLSKVSI